jgi:hypothetical protein
MDSRPALEKSVARVGQPGLVGYEFGVGGKTYFVRAEYRIVGVL